MKITLRILFLVILMLLSASFATAQDGDLRTVEFDFPQDYYAEVELTLDSNDVSVLFNVTTSDPDDFIALVEAYGSDGEPIYIYGEESVLSFGFEPATDGNGGQLGVFLPTTPDYELGAGTYFFVFEAETSEITSVSALVRSGNVDSRQAIDLNLWVLTEELADESQQQVFESAIRKEIDNVLNPHNMQLGEVNFTIADAEEYDNFSYPAISEEDGSALENVCEAMSESVGTGQALNVAITEGFDDLDDGGYAGIAIGAGNAGIIMENSRFSCVIVSYEAYGEDYANQAVNILHEGGHFMSLPHTTESEGDLFDRFADTPECSAADYDENGDGTVDDFECGQEGGASNLMFWSGEPDFAPFRISDSQAWVLRRHPLFYSVSN